MQTPEQRTAYLEIKQAAVKAIREHDPKAIGDIYCALRTKNCPANIQGRQLKMAIWSRVPLNILLQAVNHALFDFNVTAKIVEGGHGYRLTRYIQIFNQPQANKPFAPAVEIKQQMPESKTANKNHLVYEKGSETIRQRPQNYLIAQRVQSVSNIGEDAPSQAHARWVCDPDLAADRDLIQKVFSVIISSFEMKYATVEELAEALN